ncbi:hypothetical protein KUCAC02_013456, partial [Chaenocephalus aceratus]
MASPLRVSILGCGNCDIFRAQPSHIINTEHENIKCLPRYKLRENVAAVPKLRDAPEAADLLVFVVPHQFIGSLCDDMKGSTHPYADGSGCHYKCRLVTKNSSWFTFLLKLSIRALVESALQLHLLDSGVRVLLMFMSRLLQLIFHSNCEVMRYSDGKLEIEEIFTATGIDEGPGGLKLVSDIIREKMGIDVSVVMGSNIANQVAAEKFCETTI